MANNSCDSRTDHLDPRFKFCLVTFLVFSDSATIEALILCKSQAFKFIKLKWWSVTTLVPI